jgi:phosphatidylserine/phosphatidylglycerophosphate/cardiolipin synthase-like enzyme
MRQPYTPTDCRMVVSPETARQRLSDFIVKARKQLLIYDDRVSDKLMLRLLRERVEKGVEVRLIGRLAKKVEGITACRLCDFRLHVRAIVRDGTTIFVGSQSLRKNELDVRREVGLIVNDHRIAARVRSIFEADWALSSDDTKDREKEEPGVKTGRPSAAEHASAQ